MNPDSSHDIQTPPSQPAPQSEMPQKSSDQKLAEMMIPINRSGWAIAAGYVALFTIPFVFVGPFAVILGILGLNSIKKNPGKIGKGRCWFAIIYGLVGTLILAWFVSRLIATA